MSDADLSAAKLVVCTCAMREVADGLQALAERLRGLESAIVTSDGAATLMREVRALESYGKHLSNVRYTEVTSSEAWQAWRWVKEQERKKQEANLKAGQPGHADVHEPKPFVVPWPVVDADEINAQLQLSAKDMELRSLAPEARVCIICRKDDATLCQNNDTNGSVDWFHDGECFDVFASLATGEMPL